MRGSLVLALSLGILGARPAQAAEPPPRFIRGMTVSCPMYGEIWGSEEMIDALKALKGMGVEWVSIHPYAAVRTDGQVISRSAEGSGYLSRAVEIAKAQGVKLFWKPHLAYWGSFPWRGEITFADDAAWKRFFDGYERFIVDQAKLAERSKVEIFSVGVEYEKTMHKEADWRRIIAAVRKVYHGKLTYAANWDGVERVKFWDALDFIGVQAYFPLGPEGVSSTDKSKIAAAWERPLGALRALSKRSGGKPILFTEIGYSRSRLALAKPWEARVDDGEDVVRLRTRLMEVALERLEKEPMILGLFWWKWMPGQTWFHDRDFSMKDPEAQAVLMRYWKQ